MSAPVPLVLIGGFLGAGKTTFLRALLTHLGETDARPHLVINDYGQAEIDAAMLAQLTASVSAINGSCVCCESQAEFLDLLARAPLDDRSVLLVETNGTTDPYEIIEALGLDPRARRYTAPLHVSIIDTQRWQKRWWHNELERQQARSSSGHFLSKTDLVPADRVRTVAEDLLQLNPHARAVTPAAIAAEVSALLGAPTASAPAHPSSPAHEHPAHDHSHAHAHRHHAHSFVSLQLPLPGTISREKMAAWLRGLPRQVIRAKGFVRLEENPARLLSFQKIEDSHDIAFLPLDPAFAREPLALLIGLDLDPAQIPPP
jgi:G3E family GTPase